MDLYLSWGRSQETIPSWNWIVILLKILVFPIDGPRYDRQLCWNRSESTWKFKKFFFGRSSGSGAVYSSKCKLILFNPLNDHSRTKFVTILSYQKWADSFFKSFFILNNIKSTESMIKYLWWIIIFLTNTIKLHKAQYLKS